MVITLVFSTHFLPPISPWNPFSCASDAYKLNSTHTLLESPLSLSCQAHTPPAFPLPHSIHLLHHSEHALSLSSPMAVAIAEAPFHVLAVDDSVLDRKLIERLLKTSSFQGINQACHDPPDSICSIGSCVSCYGMASEAVSLFVSAVTTVDSGTKALEFLGLHGEDASISSVHADQLVRRY